ncbi:hypothetical protein Y032_0010g997 [Ancylostoma ceylanicum]|uniref:Uncharacterized protein n=1 Tax=Ancylostoma ceylanicum TaxID=53326 RepID=A0A016VII0_9BILA|nr:hypothetical protein Y032_0010g997 [Ancylostoma ceylanicum]
MFRGSRKKFGRDRSRSNLSLLLERSQRSSRSLSLVEDETVMERKEGSRIDSIMKSTRETKAASQEKLLVYRFVRRVMEKGVRGLRTEFFSMKRSNNLTLMQKFVQMNPKGKNRYKMRASIHEGFSKEIGLLTYLVIWLIRASKSAVASLWIVASFPIVSGLSSCGPVDEAPHSVINDVLSD